MYKNVIDTQNNIKQHEKHSFFLRMFSFIMLVYNLIFHFHIFMFLHICFPFRTTT